MATYKQIGRNNWKVTISIGNVNGKRKRITKQGFKTKKEAKTYADEIENDNKKDYYTCEERNILYKDFIVNWYNDCKEANISLNTKAKYNSAINKYIIPLLGDYKLSELNNRIIQSFYNKLITTYKLKASSAIKIYTPVHSSLAYAKKHKLIKEVCTDIEKRKIEYDEVKCWTKDEVNFFLNAIKDKSIYKPVFFTLMTGVRVGELCGIRWCDINFKEEYVSIKHQVVRERHTSTLILTDKLKTKSSYRNIFLPPILVEYLLQLKEELNPSPNDFLITSAYKKTMSNPDSVSARFKFMIDRYPNLTKITFHGLRHTHATLLIEAGENIKVVSERLGHKDVSTTLNIYTHTSNKMHKKVAGTLNNLFQ